MATILDNRASNSNKERLARMALDTITIPNGGMTEVTDTAYVNGIIRQITVTINDNTGNATATVQVRDADDAILWTEAAIAENATTVFQYNTRSSTDLPMAICCAGTMTIGCTPSGDPGASTMTCDVALWVE